MSYFIQLASNSEGKSASGLMIYKAISKSPHFQDLTGLNKQPDSVFNSVYFENSVSINYFSGERKLFPDNFEFIPLSQWTLHFTDLNFSIKKNAFCNTRFRLPYKNVSINPTGKARKFVGFTCAEYYSYNNFDTTFYYITNELNKSAGIIILENISGCIIAAENNLYRIHPVLFDKAVRFDLEPLRDFKKNAVDISSANQDWITGEVSNIKVNVAFPSFSARDIRKKGLNQNSLKSKNGKYSVIVFLDHLQPCEDYPPTLAHYYSGAKEQNSEILQALNELSLKRNSAALVITDDYWESIKEKNLPGVRIIPNGAEWRDKLKIFQFPTFVIVDDKGVVREILTVFDLDASADLRSGLEGIIEKWENR